MLLRGRGRAAGIEAILSICGHREFPIDMPEIEKKLILHFDDIEPPDPDDSLSMYRHWARQKWAKENGLILQAPVPGDAQRIIDFARATSEANGTVLFQCQGGTSRSPAAALICLATWLGDGQEQNVVELLLRARPSAVPLRGLVGFGDTLLNREGRLLRALNQRLRG